MQRQMDDLVELACVNERLAGRLAPWEARARLEVIKARRRNWEAIVDYVTRQDVEVTLELIEEANARVSFWFLVVCWRCLFFVVVARRSVYFFLCMHSTDPLQKNKKKQKKG